jgi:sigma54-dependent transcription regulator
LTPSNSSASLAPPEKKKFSFLHKSQSADSLSQRRLSAPGKLDGDFVSFSSAGLNSQLSQANHSSLQSLSKGVFAGAKRDASHMSGSASTGSLNLLELEALNKKKKRKSMGPTSS